MMDEMKTLSTKLGLTLISIIIITTAITALYIKEPYRFHLIGNAESIIVIKPIFTSTAYQPKGFYDYFKLECGSECLTIKINETLSYSSSKNAIKVFEWNKVRIVTDIDVHKNPNILSQYKTVILLHNEYVTQEEFVSITSHPNVIYLYPNALYGKIKFAEDQIILERGHNYPETTIRNGFDWKYDNSKMEYDTKCLTWNFYRIENGYMLNCYPEHVIKTNMDILKKIGQLSE